MLFDRICRENGIKHILTAPRSPTTTGKVERWHKTLRREFLNGKVFDSIEDAQAQLDAWVHELQPRAPHQGIGMSSPCERFRLAASEPASSRSSRPRSRRTTRRVGETGKISFAAAARTRSGCGSPVRPSRSSVDDGLVSIHHRGVLVATHARRHRPGQGASRRSLARSKPTAAAAASGDRRPVGDPQGRLVRQRVASPARTTGSATSSRRRQVQVAIVGDTVEISAGGEVLKVHPIRHDRTREHGALANPGGRPSPNQRRLTPTRL